MLLIITPSQFLASMKKLRNHKQRTGMSTAIITLEKIYQTYQGLDEAEKVKRCILDYNNKFSVRYVLLVGDGDLFPIRYTKTDRKHQPAQNTAFYPTDLYYSCLFKTDGSFDDWNGNNNAYYGELHGEIHTGTINIDAVNMTPTVAVGRIPATTGNDVNIMIDKIISYELNAYKSDWSKRLVTAATHDYQKTACSFLRNLSSQYLTAYNHVNLSSSGSTCLADRNLTEGALVSELNKGCGLLLYYGHGSPYGMAIPGGYFSRDSVKYLNNRFMLPVMFASACSTGEFTSLPPYEPYTDINGTQHPGTKNNEYFNTAPPQPSCIQNFHDPDNDLATQLTVKTPHGAVAYIGGVTGMQGGRVLGEFAKAYPHHDTLGDIYKAMVKNYYTISNFPETLSDENWGIVAGIHQPWKYMLFGDPSLRVKGIKRGFWSRQMLTRGERGTSQRPALVKHDNKLYKVWKGKYDDKRIFISYFDDEGWSGQKLTNSNFRTDSSPSIISYNGQLYLFWSDCDTHKIHFSIYENGLFSNDTVLYNSWRSKGTPVASLFQNKLMLTWRVFTNSSTNPIIFSFYDGSNWKNAQFSGFFSDCDPGLCSYSFSNTEGYRRIMMVKKGSTGDPKIYYSIYNGNNWSILRLTSHDRGTSATPSIAEFDHIIYMTWKGKDNDQRIFFSEFYGNRWQSQKLAHHDRGTSHGPVLCVYDSMLFNVWKGKYDDPRMFWSVL